MKEPFVSTVFFFSIKIKLEKALETFRCHAKYSYHRTAVINADNIIPILNNKRDNVLVHLNNQLKDDILQNRNMLKPIIQTIRL